MNPLLLTVDFITNKFKSCFIKKTQSFIAGYPLNSNRKVEGLTVRKFPVESIAMKTDMTF